VTHLAALPPHFPFDDDEHLAAQITPLAGQINTAHYRLLKLIAEFDKRKGWSGGSTLRSCAHWRSWQRGTASRVEQVVDKSGGRAA